MDTIDIYYGISVLLVLWMAMVLGIVFYDKRMTKRHFATIFNKDSENV